jgi:hypothetical protein
MIQSNNPYFLDALIEKYEDAGKWKKRRKYEQEKLKVCHHFIILHGEIVWWFSLQNFNNNWIHGKIIEYLWCGEEWVWIGEIILKKVQSDFPSPLFAYTKSPHVFLKNGFIEVEWEVSESGAKLYKIW